MVQALQLYPQSPQNDLYAPPDGAARPSVPLADLSVGHTLKEVQEKDLLLQF